MLGKALVSPCARQAYTCLFVNRAVLASRVTPIRYGFTDTKKNLNLLERKSEYSRNKFKESLEEKKYSGYVTSQNVKELLPSPHLFETEFNGIPFKDLPIFDISFRKNNVFMKLFNGEGEFVTCQTVGQMGFTNCRKKTSTAAQILALHMIKKCDRHNLDNVRLCISGFSSTRQEVITTIIKSNLNVVSVTDTTPVRNGQKPRKKRRL